LSKDFNGLVDSDSFEAGHVKKTGFCAKRRSMEYPLLRRDQSLARALLRGRPLPTMADPKKRWLADGRPLP
jgi:hypothetical protein